MDNTAMFKLTYGLYVLTTKSDGRDNGCIINTAIQAASAPNQISIAVNKANLTHDMIRRSGRFNISVIGQDAPFALFKRFGFQSGRDVDKFADFANVQRGENGIYYVTEGINAYMAVKVEKEVDLGSHTLFIGEPTAMEVLSDVPSVTYTYYQEHIKPRSGAADQSHKKQTIWSCTVCGYEYEGEELPEDFICPICNHTADFFVKE